MRVSVDLDRCEAHGVCTGIAPDVFELDDDDMLQVLLPSPPAERLEQMREAAMRCPKQAITVEE
jgi:ferredoxin